MGLYPRILKPSDFGLPQGPYSNVFVVDPANGDDDNRGTSFEKPLATLAAAYAKCVANQHDTVALISGPTACNPEEAIVWAKNFTHLVGLSGDLPGMGQRARIVNHADNDLDVLFTLSGSGCIFRNLQAYDGKDADEDAACVLVSGSRNLLENCFFAGMGHATPAARAGSYSLKLTGAENCLRACTIGLDTVIRAAANAELIVAGARNRFIDCDLRSYSETAGKFLVKIDNADGDLRDTIFQDCLFFNYTQNWAGGIDNVFDMPAGGNTHWVVLRGNCVVVGKNNAGNAGTGWADVVTCLYGAGPAPNAGFGVGLNPTT